jgi:RecJ-like exonuclease
MASDTTCPLCAGVGTFTAPTTHLCPQCHGKGVLLGDFVPHTQPTMGQLLPWEQPCPTCHDTGEQAGSIVVFCALCHGRGRVPAATLVLPVR